ncbi:MAG: RelA/SpoT family protein [Patescibacteria group bacterium]
MVTLKKLLSLRERSFKKEQVELISKAYYFAQKAHQGQKRKSGEDYFSHSTETAATLVRMGLGSKTVAAGLLHDVPEDTPVTLQEVEEIFGKEIAFIVDGITKVGQVRLRGRTDEVYLENLRKMFLAMGADIRVVLIKIADRLHNMKTLYALPEDKQVSIARETMDVFVPIANRLGIGEIKNQLEDLAFMYLDPENYEKTVKLSQEALTERKRYTERAISELKRELRREKVTFLDIYGRAKHYYRFFQKLKKHNMEVDKVYDLSAIRIIVPSVESCYKTLGVVHQKYNPLIGRIKDYISLPKPNGYKSLHTTIFGPEGKILEIQIRTQKMDYEAEYGIAAHWIYSDKTTFKEILFGQGSDQLQKQLKWVKQLREWHTETGGMSDEFWSSLKIDFFKNHIFAFTPLGDVIELPEGATPVDFAYQIHTEVGNKLSGAKVNQKMVALDYCIKNGDVVELIKDKNKKAPNRNWLDFVKTAQARSKIKQALKKVDFNKDNKK